MLLLLSQIFVTHAYLIGYFKITLPLQLRKNSELYFYLHKKLFRVEEYINKSFDGTGIKIEVVKGQGMFEDMYPCLAAVNRASSLIPRHDGRVIWLTYEPEGPVEKTLMLVGKGITYDTGNHNDS